MKYSKMFGKTGFGEVRGSDLISHQMLVRGGFIRESTAGRYFFLPLGWRVHEKIKKIIKTAMDETGAQEMISPVLHPLELWQETNRTKTTGFELLTVTDRAKRTFALGGTAEEMFVDVIRKFQISYKDLPMNLYQFSTKFRDELRARGGLLRVREFVMKDAYSFDKDETEFKKVYGQMQETYIKIFKKCGLETMVVEADNGYIGGEYCHELVVEHPLGESTFFVSEDNQYIAHEDVARFEDDGVAEDQDLLPYTEIEAKRGKTMIEGAKFHQLPLEKQLKSVLYHDDKKQLYLAIIRGDLEVNEAKLLHVVKANYLEPATEAEIMGIGSYPGFISPVGLESKVKVIADKSLSYIKNMYGGANKKEVDGLNINLDRDYKVSMMADIALAKEGFMAPNNHGKLSLRRGIEVGNIFQLGYHYTNLMKDAVFMDADGKRKPYYMGCYGIGLGRTMATIAEKHHDEKGLIWPRTVAPYQVHLVSLEKRGQTQSSYAENVYKHLINSGVEVLWDDRDESPGKKFADADMIGIPFRVVISARTGDKLEWKARNEPNTELISIEEVGERLVRTES